MAVALSSDSAFFPTNAIISQYVSDHKDELKQELSLLPQDHLTSLLANCNTPDEASFRMSSIQEKIFFRQESPKSMLLTEAEKEVFLKKVIPIL